MLDRLLAITRDVSIKRKLMASMFFVTFIAVGSGFLFLVISNLSLFRREAIESADHFTKVLSDFIVAPLSFNDRQGAEEVLSHLESTPSIVKAAVFDRHGALLASYQRKTLTKEDESLTQKEETEFEPNYLRTRHRVFLDGKFLGTVSIITSTAALDQKNTEFIFFSLVVIVAVLAVTLLLSYLLQAYISRPILDLAAVAKSISEKENFSVRVTPPNKDEIGQLYQAFNSLLEQIERRDQQREQAEARRMELAKQLEHSQRLETIGTMAGGIAHDFNNILTPMMGCVDLAEREIPPQHKARNWLRIIKESAERAKELVAQILAFGRQSSGPLERLRVDDVLTGVIKLLRASTPSTIAINTSIRPKGGVVLASPAQIHQILVNLCANASYAMKDRGGILTITVETLNLSSSQIPLASGLSPGRYCEVIITDTGTGMDPATLNRIFEPFFTTKPLGEGTGLGLSVVHGIVKSLGGHITVQSQPNLGTSFSVLLPETEDDHSNKVECAKPIPAEEGPHKRILFVDDEEIICEIGQDLLTSLGYVVFATRSPIVALNQFKKGPQNYDLVITDQTMPEMSSLELAQKIWEIRPTMPVLLTTGFAGDSLTQELAGGQRISGFLRKPYSAQDLVKHIEDALTA